MIKERKNVKAAIILATGNEEGETLFLADLLRRGNMECDLISLKEEWVEGMHHIIAKADKILENKLEDYDVLVLPGGFPAGDILRSDPRIRDIILDFHKKGKYLAGICFGVLALYEAGVLDGKKVTGYRGYKDKMPKADFVGGKAVADGTIITGQAPGAAYEFAFKILETTGYNVNELKQALMF